MGRVIDTNSFGTDEFMDFIQQIGARPMSRSTSKRNSAGSSRMAGIHDRRATDGAGQGTSRQRHPEAYKVGFLGIGNESWSCGGDMTAEYYLSQLKIYTRFVGNDNPSQQGPNHMLKIAVGPGFPKPIGPKPS